MQSPLDLVVAGDFLQSGRDQILVISRGNINIEPALSIYSLDEVGGNFQVVFQRSREETASLAGWRSCALARVVRRRSAASMLALLLG